MEPKNWKIEIDMMGGSEAHGKSSCGCSCETCKCGKKDKMHAGPALQLLSIEAETERLFSIVGRMDGQIMDLQRMKRWPGSGRFGKKH
ncbi:MAG: hypothetical protein HY954_02140 [Deltaproteobacteria bacterium]|nr:hypothetical protein [Deltaproteobacteria bacterium]